MNGTNDNAGALILIVDDDPVARALMRATLENDQFRVIEADDGLEGCRQYEEHHPELLLVESSCRAWTATNYAARCALSLRRRSCRSS